MKASPIILCQISNLVFNFYFYFFFCLQGKRQETKNKNKNKNYKMYPTLTKLYRNS